MNVWKRGCLVVASALLGAVVFAPIGLWWLAVVAWIPLLFGIRGASTIAASRLGVLHGVIFYGITMSWIVNVFAATPWMVVPLVMVMSLFTGVFSAGFSYASRTISNAVMCALLSGVWWVAVEFVRSEIYILKFPWMTPGVGLGPSFISPLIGVYGISFLIIGLGVLCLNNGRSKWLGGAGLIGLIFATYFQSLKSIDIENGVKVFAVQAEEVSHEDLMGLVSAADDSVDAIVFPEYSYDYDVRKVESEWQSLQELSARASATLVLGTKTNHADGSWQNTALTLNDKGVLGSHYKNHTVHFFNDGVAGTQVEGVDTPHGRIGAPICFDNDYEDVVRRMTTDGAEYFLVPSMDAKHWSEREHWQHAELFRHRAAENGRWMVVASSSGLTQVIDQNGSRVDSLPLMAAGVLSTQVERLGDFTIYSRWGWLFPWLCLIVGCGTFTIWGARVVFKSRFSAWHKE